MSCPQAMSCRDCGTTWYSRIADVIVGHAHLARCVRCQGQLALDDLARPDPGDAPPDPVAELQRTGETWRFAREQLRELPGVALRALAAREHLPTTARLVEGLADEALPPARRPPSP